MASNDYTKEEFEAYQQEVERDKLELSLLYQLFALDLPEPEREYHFAREVVGEGPGIRERFRESPLKDWRFDFAWRDERVAVEVEGGTWVDGRHVRGGGYADDCTKYNWAARLGWTVFRFTGDMVQDGGAATFLEEVLC